MTEFVEVPIEVKEKTFHWFLKYDPADPNLLARRQETIESDSLDAVYDFQFDYERLGEDQWRLFMDIALDVFPIAHTTARTTFEVQCSEQNLGSTQIAEQMIMHAIDTANKVFREQSKLQHIPVVAEFPPGQELAKNFATTFTDQFTNHRLPREKQYPFLFARGLHLVPGSVTVNIVKGIYLILEQVLFLSKDFKTELNLQAFNAEIPSPVYFTIRDKCMKIDSQEVYLNWLQTVCFYISLDCALQLLIGDHADKLIPMLDAKGYDETERQRILESGTKMFEELKASLEENGAAAIIFEQQRDWNKMIH